MQVYVPTSLARTFGGSYTLAAVNHFFCHAQESVSQYTSHGECNVLADAPFGAVSIRSKKWTNKQSRSKLFTTVSASVS